LKSALLTWDIGQATVDELARLGVNNYVTTYIWQWVKTLVPLVNIKIAGKWMFIPLKMVLIGIDS